MALNRGPLGLDELMIVNPATPGVGACFLGADGVFYAVEGLGALEPAAAGGDFALGDCFLGEDGAVYEVVR